MLKQPHERLSHQAFSTTAADFYRAMIAATGAIQNSTLDPQVIELVEVRASQINGCAFCIQNHLEKARKVEVSQAKLDLLPAWHDATIYSEAERAALAWAEELTNISQTGTSDETWQQLQEHFSEQEIVFLTAAIATINSWNRISASLRFSSQ